MSNCEKPEYKKIVCPKCSASDYYRVWGEYCFHYLLICKNCGYEWFNREKNNVEK